MDASVKDMDDIRAMVTARSDRLLLGYLYGGSVRYQPGEVLGPRDLTDYELVLLTEGHAIYQADGARHETHPVIWCSPARPASRRNTCAASSGSRSAIHRWSPCGCNWQLRCWSAPAWR